MTRATPAIPDPPRAVRWATCLQHRRGAGITGIALVLAGIALYAYVVADKRGGPLFADTRLDTGAASAPGTIQTVETVGEALLEIRFRFRSGAGRGYEGVSYAPARASFRAEQPVAIEYWPEDPQTNRVAGTEAVHFAPTPGLLANLCLACGLLTTAFWYRGAVRMRITLREGRATEAQVIEVAGGRRLRLSYRFRDADGAEVIRTQSTPRRSPLGAVLSAGPPRTVTVIHDVAEPRLCRAVCPAEFDPGEPT